MAEFLRIQLHRVTNLELLKVQNVAAHHAHVRFRHAVRRIERTWVATVPTRWQEPSQKFPCPPHAADMGWVLRHFREDPPFEQFDVVVLGEDAGLRESVVLSNRQAVDRPIGRCRLKRWWGGNGEWHGTSLLNENMPAMMRVRWGMVNSS